jgi:hypothetical protein
MDRIETHAMIDTVNSILTNAELEQRDLSEQEAGYVDALQDVLESNEPADLTASEPAHGDVAGAMGTQAPGAAPVGTPSAAPVAPASSAHPADIQALLNKYK